MNWIFSVLAIITVTSCSRTENQGRELASNKDWVWQDLRIQQLLPEYLTFPAIEPYLPENFIGLRDSRPGRNGHVYWGERDAVEGLLKTGSDYPKSAVIRANISLSIAQVDEDSFSVDEDSLRKDLVMQGAEDIVIKKWK